eukprot:CAMPEP_0185273878 /NCGR_PEP_ID=MMETSP1359-20130426/50533_1 /TAXON_ID=552665 /ORGANISM="Bigelowiella longifila, Strain CCMP242" /LENGTH=189 /DNA_ID=CAMNT_0027866653 /DNA_START=82 /DNA_END=651 /DNA_ORIENTATION=+
MAWLRTLVREDGSRRIKEKSIAVLKEEEIDGLVLQNITEDQLKEMGIKTLGQRGAVLAARDTLNQQKGQNNSSGDGVDSKALKALQEKLEEVEKILKLRTAEKEKMYMQVSHLQRIYGQVLQENEGLKNQLRRAGAKADGKKQDVWIPSKAPPPNMLPRAASSSEAADGVAVVSRSSKFFRPDRHSTHV